MIWLTDEKRLQSWTKGWREIHKIKQNRFFYGMFYSWFFAIFYPKTSKFGFWVDGWVLSIKPKHFRDFLEVLSRSATREELVHSLSGDNNLVPHHLWWKQIVLKSEKVSKCFVQHCSLIANLRHAVCRTWTCAESEFRPCWMKLRSSDNHYTTTPQKLIELSL